MSAVPGQVIEHVHLLDERDTYLGDHFPHKETRLQAKLTFRAQLRHEAHEGDLGIDEGVEQIMEGGVALKVHHDRSTAHL
jgi:hypothetical protein